LGGDGERAEMLGWCDQDYLYLLPEACYTRICRHFREQGGLFPVRQSTLRKGLKEAGWLVAVVRARRTIEFRIINDGKRHAPPWASSRFRMIPPKTVNE
jgi:hypothetical protein